MMQAAEIRGVFINWQSYLQCQMITESDYNFIVEFDKLKEAPKERDAFIQNSKLECPKTFINLISRISKDQTVQYILTLIDDMFEEDKSRVKLFHEYTEVNKSAQLWSSFLNLLNRQDIFTVHMSSRIMAKLASFSSARLQGSDLNFYLTWLNNQLTVLGNDYLQSVVNVLQTILRVDDYRLSFVKTHGIKGLVDLLNTKVSFQLQYQITHCLWLLAFNPLIATKMNEHNVIPVLADILRDSSKEKVTRIVLATLRNLLEKPSPSEVQGNALAMIHSKVISMLIVLENKNWADSDIKDDIDFIHEKLSMNLNFLSTFDEYAGEVKSGHLEWSPVHRSERFWRENASMLNENNYEILKILLQLLSDSRDPLVLAIAAHDIGEYVRHYGAGKRVIEKFGGKERVMQLMTHSDQQVRYEALLAVQKLMVHHWEYLGKQVPNENEKQGVTAKK
ncbi:uncharacterized protein TRIADDRAFT_36227 [Trichoplax adhaerens]|uniref:V-type proton ATPase subunit H n=1 Tax=Trichoplax adhaerens TaxID=10228 RepID=B3S152_TRIAD|nr:hypothetical protein TRIADDRAFT_36227 [Trichoplax adhaerens]EDV23506.1 hypothetical protein TRIADDRAFT_36227 [Trichoplax adhaerens]|eukprot:XP_002114416.1 hypothetical protein TRIADDRAFT_36227 [Trichoplax adhaerens]